MKVSLIGGGSQMNTSSPMADFKVKFDGPPEYIDAQTLINALLNISTALEEINRELEPDTHIEIKIRAVEPGSFWLDLSLLSKIIPTLFSKEGFNAGSKIIKALVDLFTLRKFLKGEKPKETTPQESKIKIENNYGQVLVVEGLVYKLYEKNRTIEKAITNTFETLEADSSVTGLEITDSKKKSLFLAKKEDFKMIASLPPKEDILRENEKKIIERADLHILRIVFEEKYKWEFYYQNHKIMAKIDDVDFFNKINYGEKFGKGDVLNVELEIFQIKDEAAGVFVNHSYRILKVIEHIPRQHDKGTDFFVPKK